MKPCYIKENDDTCDLVKRAIIHIKRYFNIINEFEDKEKVIYYLPFFKDTKIRKKRIKKIVKKIVSNLENKGIQDVVLSNYLLSMDLLKLKLYSESINILEGRHLFKCLTYEVIKYIAGIRNRKVEELEITILINELNTINKETIIYIAQKVKRLNIVTNHINRFKQIEDYLYEEFGIMLNISDNKNMSLLKSKIIINFDFPEELVNKYKIYNKAIIINILEKICIYKKQFQGINANYFKINLPNKYELKEFDNEIIYESIIYKYKQLNNIMNKIIEDKISIKKLVGNNGTIREAEIKRYK